MKASQLLDLIKNQEVLIKIVNSDKDDPESWQFLLQQLRDPGNVRPVRDLKPGANRERVYNPKIQLWTERKIVGERGRPKWTRYIKKTALTLPPPDGVMSFFSGRRTKYGIGIIFNINNLIVFLKEVLSPGRLDDVSISYDEILGELLLHLPQPLILYMTRNHNERLFDQAAILKLFNQQTGHYGFSCTRIIG